MDHGGMDHGGKGHGGMDMSPTACKMVMIWDWSVPTADVCVVFSSWRIRNQSDFILSVLAIVFLGALCEWLRLFIRSCDQGFADAISSGSARTPHRGRASVLPSNLADSSSGSDISTSIGDGRGLLNRSKPKGKSLRKAGGAKSLIGIRPLPISRASQLQRSILYGASVFLSFFLMLVFMTYNFYLIGAIVFGAILGHYLFNRDLAQQSRLSLLGDRGAACH
ncbi:Ctr copper transporter [Tilletiaria anomala UBC 951]|uniref:Copper transport protein n=1 Tax=Tilletiaria anomala (strain ATCC 24038 / CBS 436.72 / UBC 951) TaxID=1037660 RepID=A0A066VAU3_TILAU|nr:Ctr copper transporter [Tilletiaria anomala UBC 951]KDN35859.1 Ctr copper transporter [Tilletiaria anomala UBC 951]